jgi:hypothetical protein
MTLLDDFVDDLMVDRRVAVAKTIAGRTDLGPRNIGVPLVERFIERKCPLVVASLTMSTR